MTEYPECDAQIQGIAPPAVHGDSDPEIAMLLAHAFPADSDDDRVDDAFLAKAMAAYRALNLRVPLGQRLLVAALHTAPWVVEPPTLVSHSGLQAVFPEVANDSVLFDRAVELGLVVPEGDEFRIPSLQILETGGKLTANGVAAAVVLEEAARLERDMAVIAERFYEIVKPSIRRQLLTHQPLGEVLARLRPLSVVAVENFFRAAMADAEKRLHLSLRSERQERRRGRPRRRS